MSQGRGLRPHDTGSPNPAKTHAYRDAGVTAHVGELDETPGDERPICRICGRAREDSRHEFDDESDRPRWGL